MDVALSCMTDRRTERAEKLQKLKDGVLTPSQKADFYFKIAKILKREFERLEEISSLLEVVPDSYLTEMDLQEAAHSTKALANKLTARANSALLSDSERHTLISRNFTDSRTRATNDMRVQRKVSAWLNKIGDILLCSGKLQADQLRKVFTDGHVYLLFALAEAVLWIRDFRPIIGKIDDAPNWKVPSKREELESGQHNRTPEDIDIYRAFALLRHIEELYKFYGHGNPISDFVMLERMDNDEEFHDRVTGPEREGLKRIELALKTVSEEILIESDVQTREWDRRLNPPDGTMP